MTRSQLISILTSSNIEGISDPEIRIATGRQTTAGIDPDVIIVYYPRDLELEPHFTLVIAENE